MVIVCGAYKTVMDVSILLSLSMHVNAVCAFSPKVTRISLGLSSLHPLST